MVVSINLRLLQVTYTRKKVLNYKVSFVVLTSTTNALFFCYVSEHAVVLLAVGVTATVAGIAIYRVYMARKQNC